MCRLRFSIPEENIQFYPQKYIWGKITVPPPTNVNAQLKFFFVNKNHITVSIAHKKVYSDSMGIVFILRYDYYRACCVERVVLALGVDFLSCTCEFIVEFLRFQTEFKVG